MKKILLCCAAGMSTSLLVNKMKAEGLKLKSGQSLLIKQKKNLKKQMLSYWDHKLNML